MNPLLFADLIKHFKTQSNMAQTLGVHRSAVSHWIKRGGIPAEHAIAIEMTTEGKFKAVDLV